MMNGEPVLRHMREARARAILRRLPNGPIKGAEIGVLAGALSAVLLHRRTDLHLTMVDTWPDIRSQRSAILNTSFAVKRRLLIHKASLDAASVVRDASLDFVFIDADHSYEACKADIAAWLPKLKPGGMLSGHDYGNPPFPGVKEAVDEFAAEADRTIALGAEFTWFIWPKVEAIA